MADYLSGGRIQGSSAPLAAISKTGLKFYYKFDDSGAATRGKIAGSSQGGYTNWGRSGNSDDSLSYDLVSVQKDAQATVNTSSSGTDHPTLSLTVGDNSNRILVVCAFRYGSGGDISGINWTPTGGSAEPFVTESGMVQNGTTETGRTEIWYLINPTAGAGTVTATWGASTGRRSIGVYSFYNVKQTSPIGVKANDDGTATVTTSTITPTTAGSMIVDCIGSGSNGAPDDTLTAGWTTLIGGDDRSHSSQYKLTPTISSANTMAWAFESAKGINWIAAEVKSASAPLDDEEWIMRFKLHIEKFELNHGSGCKVAIGMSNTDADTAYGSNQDSITFQIKFASGSSEQDFRAANSSDAEMESNTVEIGTNMLTSSAGKDYWVEVKRTSETAGTVSVGENSDFTTGRTSASLSGLNSSCSDLRYFVSKIFGGGYVDNHVYGDVSEVKIYDNQSSPTTVTYDVEDFMKATTGWNINGSAIQNIVPQSKDLISSASAIGSSDAVANATIDLEYKAEGTRGVTGKVDEAISITSGDAKGQASGTMRTDTNFISQTGAIWTICFWAKMDSRVGDQAFVTTTDMGAGEDGLMLRMQNSSGGINCICGGQATGNKVNATSSSAVIPNTGTWNFVMAQYSDTTGDLKMSVNNGTVETVATGQNITNTGTPARQLTVGNTPQLDNDLNGDMDELSIWNRILTAGEITAIYTANNADANLGTVQAAGDPEKDSITNVPVGTRYEETDTRKIFRRAIQTATHTQSSSNTLTGVDLYQTTGGGGWGIKIVTGHTLIGKKMNSITFNFKIVNASGYSAQTISLKHFGETPSTTRTGIPNTGSTMSTDDVATTATDYTFTFANPVTIAADDFIMLTVPNDIGSAGGWQCTISDGGEETGSYVTTWIDNASTFTVQSGQSRKMKYSTVYQSGEAWVEKGTA